MRVPSVILLSSAALSLIVRADSASSPSSSSPLLTNPDNNNNDNNHQAILIADNSASIDNQFDPEKTYPVGKGIVYTKTRFLVKGNKSKMENNGADGAQELEKGSTDNSSDDQADSSVDAITFIGNFFGIDLGGGSSAGGDKDMDATWEETPLFGDKGYVPRVVPEGCVKLEHMDQMIWDQQGDRGEVTRVEQHHRKVNHKQRKFQRQFRGKALQIDGNTGCPLPIVS